MIRYLLFGIILLAASPLLAQDKRPSDPLFDAPQDPIGETLTIAKTSYEKEVAAASELLLDAIDAKIKRVESSSKMKMESQLEMLKVLAAEREAFVSDSNQLPSQRSLKSAVKKFERVRRKSISDLEDAFDDAAEAYRKPPKKNFEAATKTLEERAAFLKKVGKDAKKKGEKRKKGAKKELTKLPFTPAFDEENWVISAPNFAEIKEERLNIYAAQGGNIVLTKKHDYRHPDVTVEVAAAAGTEAFLILNAQLKEGKWSGVTSKIHFANGKINAGGQRTGFRENLENREFEVGEDFRLRLYVRQHPGDAGAKLVKSNVNNSGTGNISYSFKNTNEMGAVGFMVTRGGLSIKSFKVSER